MKFLILLSWHITNHRFYDDFNQIIRQKPLSHKLVILGDFNARVEKQLYIYIL